MMSGAESTDGDQYILIPSLLKLEPVFWIKNGNAGYSPVHEFLYETMVFGFFPCTKATSTANVELIETADAKHFFETMSVVVSAIIRDLPQSLSNTRLFPNARIAGSKVVFSSNVSTEQRVFVKLIIMRMKNQIRKRIRDEAINVTLSEFFSKRAAREEVNNM